MPKSNTTSSNTKRTTNLKIPLKLDGSIDNRYSIPQFTKKDGSRDMRTTLTGLRK
jgi:hypothetical protein